MRALASRGWRPWLRYGLRSAAAAGVLGLSAFVATALLRPCTTHTLVVANARSADVSIRLEIEGNPLASAKLARESAIEIALDLGAWDRADGTAVAIVPTVTGAEERVPLAYSPGGSLATLLDSRFVLVILPDASRIFVVEDTDAVGFLGDPILHALGLSPVGCADKRLIG